MNYKPNKPYYKPQRYAIDFNVVNKWVEELEALQPGEFDLEWRDLGYATDMIVIVGETEYSIRASASPTIMKTGCKIYGINNYQVDRLLRDLTRKKLNSIRES